MYIGDFIKEYREANGVSIEDFSTKAGLTVTEIEALENNLQEDGTVIPVAMRQIKGIAAAMSVPMPVVMAQIPSDQELVVHVVAESDQPHAK
ncbi:MAG: helix-turn-helix transcriptional regulator [Veillonella sp.]|uniref:helix-turn-helix domain-containing protein n=1 Tax=Veillonella sp. TaxID=1926307 RepID=UPI0025D60051|nr:helix-turn-helix transcriptional regulator [Veillonella sp.]MBS5336299.1 helix-turn-helix transcriptional regulator [Veillonella sp.]